MIYDKIIITNVPNFNICIETLKEIGIDCEFDNTKANYINLCFRIEINKIRGYEELEYYKTNFFNYTHIEFKTLLRKNKLKKLL